MCTCNGKQVRYLIYKRNTLLATCNSEEEALQAAKEVRGYVCVDVTEKGKDKECQNIKG